MPKSNSLENATPAVKAAYKKASELSRLQEELRQAQEMIADLREENRQLREHMRSDKLSERAKQALRSKGTWRIS